MLRLAALLREVVSLPAFVFELDRLDRDGVGVQLGNRLVVGNPATMNLVRQRQLAGSVVDFDDDVLPKVLERDFGAQPRAVVPDLAGPAFEHRVVRDTGFSVIAPNFVWPGDLCSVLGSPPTPCVIGSLVRFKRAHLADPSHFTRKRNFL